MSEVFTNEELLLDFEVTEMTEDLTHVVKLPANRVASLLEEYADDKPQFPILRIESGKSGNNNQWSDNVLADVCEQINSDERPGYWGHIKPEDRGYVFPDIETMWLGAAMKNEGGKKVLYVKGYNLPGSKARKHKSMAKLTSWAGKATGRFVGGVRIIEKFALESIDWARPGTAGMNARVVGVVTEMEGSEDMDWSKATLADIERENPSLFALMKQKVESEQQTTVTEMQQEAEAGKDATKTLTQVREALKIDDKENIVTYVTEMVERFENTAEKTLKDKVKGVVDGKLKNERARSVVFSLIPLSEMEGLSDDDLDTKIEEQFSSNDNIKAVITEMEQGPAPLSGGSRRRDMNGDKVGQSGHVTVGSQKL